MKHHAILIGLSLGLSLGLSHVAHSQAPARVRTVSAKPCPAPAPLFVVDGVVQPDCPSPAVENAPGDDPLARFLFPPELVMAHQQEISLTDRQRSGIQEAMKDAQGRFIDAQFKMSGEVEKMQRLIRTIRPSCARLTSRSTASTRSDGADQEPAHGIAAGNA